MEVFEQMDSTLAEILGIENEYDILAQKAKTPEEIERWCTKEDMPEVKRCVHLMKKGYEIQKISVINHLFRYMSEPGSNEELFSLIIDSMMDWDDKMQKECAKSFIQPIKMDLVNERNKQKVLKASIQICSDDDNAENTDLIEKWFKVLETVVGRVQDRKFVAEHATKQLKDIPSLKNPFPKRKRGIRLIFVVAKNVGEEGIDDDPQLLKSIMNICSDNNYKIRRDGVLFFKEYFKEGDIKKIIKNDRFAETYLPTLLDFINDEDLHIQIDAIEACCEVLDQLSAEELEKEFIPCVLNNMDIENQSQIEINQRMAEVFGIVIYQMSLLGLHMKYRKEFITYYKQICNHKQDSIRLMGVFNLPCMNLLFKSVEQEMDISFQDLYLKFSDDDVFEIRKCAATSLHEAFKITEDEEDTTKLRQCLMSYILDANREIILLLNKNLGTIISKYGNAHTVKIFKGRTAYVEASSDSGSNKDNTPKSKSNITNEATSFSAAVKNNKSSSQTREGSKSRKNKQIQKKNTNLAIHYEDLQEEQAVKLAPIYVTPEHQSEVIYSDMLQRLMVYINNMKCFTGLWREHKILIQNLTECIHLFYMPEVHQYLVPMLMDFVYKGNNPIKEEACHCLAKILKYQHNSTMRDELLGMINKEMCQSNNWIQRKAFIYFCKYAVQLMSREFFKKYYMKDYIQMSLDKVPHVRMEFANAMLIIKPYFDVDVDLSLELMDILSSLNNDSDRDVLEAVEHTDFELLQSRKKNKDMNDDTAESDKIQFQKFLLQREKNEIEERKKRVDDDDDGKYDMSNFLESKRWRNKANKYNVHQRRPVGSLSSGKSNLGGSVSTLKKLPLSSMNAGDTHNDSKTPIKKKNTMNFKKTSNLNNGFNEIDFQKQRKNSVLIGGTKEEQNKRYHQMVSSNGQQQMNGQNHRIGNASNTSNGLKTGGPGLKKRNTFVNGNGGGERL